MPTKDEPRITFRLGGELHGRLEAEAARRGVKVGALAREACERYLGPGQSPNPSRGLGDLPRTANYGAVSVDGESPLPEYRCPCGRSRSLNPRAVCGECGEAMVSEFPR